MGSAQPIKIVRDKRTCGTCTKCCEGFLQGKAYDQEFWPGRKCGFLCNSKCSIYEQRPDDPCKSYVCGWLNNEDIPGWMKPNEINAIVTFRKVKDVEYIDLVEAGSKLDSEVLSWFVIYILRTGKNLRYVINGGVNRIGNKDFLAMEL